jgi:hypothetical protein
MRSTLDQLARQLSNTEVAIQGLARQQSSTEVALAQHRSSTEISFAEVRESLQQLRRFVQREERSSDQAKASSVLLLMYSMMSNNVTGNGCGNVVRIGNSLFIASVKHNFIDMRAGCLRSTRVKVVFSGGKSKVFLLRKLQLLVHPEYDLALLKLPRGVDVVAARITNRDRVYIRPSETLYGWATRPDKSATSNSEVVHYGVSAHVHQVDELSGSFLSNMQGASGFSGTGLFFDGELFALHHGSGSFPHSGDSTEESVRRRQKLFKNFNQACENSSSGQACFNAIQQVSRNPVSTSVFAHNLLSRKMKKSKAPFCKA